MKEWVGPSIPVTAKGNIIDSMKAQPTQSLPTVLEGDAQEAFKEFTSPPKGTRIQPLP
jgi:hypothetical protein